MPAQGPPLTPGTRRRLEALFCGDDRERVARQLLERCGDGLPMTTHWDESQFERVRYAVLKLSGGDLHELERAIQLANWDWRDLLMAADFGHDVTAHERWFPAAAQ